MPDTRHQKTRRQKNSGLQRIAGWSVRHRWLAVSGWFAMVAAAVVLSGLATGAQTHTTDPGESGRAQAKLNEQNVDSPEHEYVLIQAASGNAAFATDPALRRATVDLIAAVHAASSSTVNSPLAPGAGGLVSADGRSGLVDVELDGASAQRSAQYDALVAAVRQVGAGHPGVLALQAGDRSIEEATDRAYGSDLRRAESLSLPLTLAILLLVFGALIGALIPVVLSLTAVVTAISLLQVVKHWMPVNSTVASMVLLIGMAVGIDYSLFYLRRVREERAAGRSLTEALQITSRTSGRAVAISGFTVMLCLAGLFLTGMDVFRGMAVGTILVVGLSVLGSVTVLPALLALLGRGVDAGRLPWLGRRRTSAGESRVWAAIARSVVRRPAVLGGAVVLGLLALALPAAGMNLADPAPTDGMPTADPTVQAVIRLQQAFPGGSAPATVVVWGRDAQGPAVQAAVAALHRQVAASGGLLGEPVQADRVGSVLSVKVPLAGSGSDATSVRALEHLRQQVLPATLGTVPGVEYAVTGKTAGPHDFSATLRSRTPLVFGFVLALAFLLLVFAFRSLVIPVASILLNLLSIGAAYGVVTLVFQDGHLSSLLGFTPYGGVLTWLPLFMFVVLFGLSMDYHIFMLSRIRERWLAGVPAREAVVRGTASSAGVITSAAVVMVAVFSIFITLSAVEYKMLGVGMAAAVLLDATVVRGVLLPAVLALFGEGTWSLPGRRTLRGPQLADAPGAAPVPVAVEQG